MLGRKEVGTTVGFEFEGPIVGLDSGRLEGLRIFVGLLVVGREVGTAVGCELVGRIVGGL